MEKEPNYIFAFVSGLIAILIIDYFILLRFNLHPTLQVFLSFMFFWIWITIASSLKKKR
jgi:hypothetical protein